MAPQSFAHGPTLRANRRKHGGSAGPKSCHASSVLARASTEQAWEEKPANSGMVPYDPPSVRTERHVPPLPINPFNCLRTNPNGADFSQPALSHAASRPSPGSPLRGNHALPQGSLASNKVHSARGTTAEQRRKNDASSRFSTQGDEWQSQFFKTKLCPYHLEGRCINGDSCRFAHSPREVRPLPDLQRTKLCESYVRQELCTDESCPFAHDPSELRTSSHSFYKVTLCNFYKKGRCWNGAHCRFAHGVTELQTVVPAEPTNLPAGPKRAARTSQCAEPVDPRLDDTTGAPNMDSEIRTATTSDRALSVSLTSESRLSYLGTPVDQTRADAYSSFLGPSAVASPSRFEAHQSLDDQVTAQDPALRMANQSEEASHPAYSPLKSASHQTQRAMLHSRRHQGGRVSVQSGLPQAYYANPVEPDVDRLVSDSTGVSGALTPDCLHQPTRHGLLDLGHLRSPHDGAQSALTERISRLPVSAPLRRNSADCANITQYGHHGYYPHPQTPALRESPVYGYASTRKSIHGAEQLPHAGAQGETEEATDMNLPITMGSTKFHPGPVVDESVAGNPSNIAAGVGQATSEEIQTLTAALVSCFQDSSVMRSMATAQGDSECDADPQREGDRESGKSATDILAFEFLRSLVSMAGGHPASTQPGTTQEGMHDQSPNTSSASTTTKDKMFHLPTTSLDWKAEAKVVDVNTPTYQQFLALAAAANGGAVDENAPFGSLSNVLDLSSLQAVSPSVQSLSSCQKSLEALRGKNSSLTLPSLSSLVLGSILTRQSATCSGTPGDVCYDSQTHGPEALDVTPRVLTKSLDNLVNFVDAGENCAASGIEASPEKESPPADSVELRMARFRRDVLVSLSGFGVASLAPAPFNGIASFPDKEAKVSCEPIVASDVSTPSKLAC